MWWGIATCICNCDFRPPVEPWRWPDIYEAGTCQWMDWYTSWGGETFRWPRLMLSLIRILSIQSLTDRRWVYVENWIVLPPPFSNINVFVIDKQSSIYIIMNKYLISNKKVVGKRIYLLLKYCCIVDFSFLWPCQWGKSSNL